MTHCFSILSVQRYLSLHALRPPGHPRAASCRSKRVDDHSGLYANFRDFCGVRKWLSEPFLKGLTHSRNLSSRDSHTLSSQMAAESLKLLPTPLLALLWQLRNPWIIAQLFHYRIPLAACLGEQESIGTLVADAEIITSPRAAARATLSAGAKVRPTGPAFTMHHQVFGHCQA